MTKSDLGLHELSVDQLQALRHVLIIEPIYDPASEQHPLNPRGRIEGYRTRAGTIEQVREIYAQAGWVVGLGELDENKDKERIKVGDLVMFHWSAPETVPLRMYDLFKQHVYFVREERILAVLEDW